MRVRGRRAVEALVDGRAHRIGQPRAARGAPPRSSSRSFFTEPNSLSSRCLRPGPRPGMSSMHRDRHLLAAELAVVRDREAVGLVAHLLEEVQRLGVARDHAPGRLGPGRYTSSNFLARLATQMSSRPSSSSTRTATLSWPLPPSITSRFGGYENRLPGVRAFVALAEVVAEPAGEHVFHRREVVLVVERLHLEAAVVGALGEAVFHHDHRRDDLGALEVARCRSTRCAAALRAGRAPPGARAACGRARCGRRRAAACGAGTTPRALSIAVSSSSRLPPRCGTRMRTFEPRFSARNSS